MEWKSVCNLLMKSKDLLTWMTLRGRESSIELTVELMVYDGVYIESCYSYIYSSEVRVGIVDVGFVVLLEAAYDHLVFSNFIVLSKEKFKFRIPQV